MTTKQASEVFGVEQKEIEKLCRKNMVYGAYKNRIWVIPEDTPTIVPFSEIGRFLWQILIWKNDHRANIDRHICPTERDLRVLARYLYSIGMIGSYSEDFKSIEDLFKSTSITDRGLEIILNHQRDRSKQFSLVVSPNFQLGLININI